MGTGPWIHGFMADGNEHAVKKTKMESDDGATALIGRTSSGARTGDKLRDKVDLANTPWALRGDFVAG
jgi:hypothetical protein